MKKIRDWSPSKCRLFWKLIRDGKTVTEIAKGLKRDVSTISAIIKRRKLEYIDGVWRENT